MASEIQACKKWMVNLLKSDSGIQGYLGANPCKVYADQASRDLGFPYILVTTMSGIDTQGQGTNRVMTIATFQVRVVTEGPPTDANKDLEALMDSILQSQVAIQAEGYEFSSRRIAIIDRPEFDQAHKRYSNIGSIQRVWISKI